MSTCSAVPELVLGGRHLKDALEQVRRYCGLPWSGGPPETWAFAYYDAIATDPARVTPVDVLSTAALHPGISRSDLAFFVEQREGIQAWLSEVPSDVPLQKADDDVLIHLAALAEWGSAPHLTLLTKVLHRKRPQLIPLIDRHVINHYRPLTGERRAESAWPRLLREIKMDLQGPAGGVVSAWANYVRTESGVSVSALRILDIAVWMDGNQ